MSSVIISEGGIVSTDPPAWEAVLEEIHCPLCDYNLRGLAEARCPECGYRFEWADLLDPNRRKHPYVFEHHPERRIWSFVKTAIGVLRPRRFWSSLHPSQPSYPRRFVGYWVVYALAIIFLFLGSDAVSAVQSGRDWASMRLRSRSQLRQWLNSPSGSADCASIVAKYGSIDAYLDATEPRGIQIADVRRAFVGGLRYLSTEASACLSWPWVSLLSLLVFQISMRRRRIRAHHVMRVAIYNLNLPVLMVALKLCIVDVILFYYLGYSPMGIWVSHGSILLVSVSAAGLALWRLTTAYRQYLQFDHPFMTVLSSQVVTALAVLSLVIVFDAALGTRQALGFLLLC